MVEDEQVVYTDPDGKVWHPHRGYWCWKVSSELAQAQERIKELEAQLAEAKAALEKIAGSHWERIGYCQTDIDDVPDLTAEEAMLTARRILAALEATPPAPKVTEETRGAIAYALTKRLVIDMPTARAAVDEALFVKDGGADGGASTLRQNCGDDTPRVHNKRHGTAPIDAVYVGRGTPWGNPYRIGVHGTRDQVLEMYRARVLPNLDVAPLRGKHLVCWCHPQRCHADFLLEKANGRRSLS